MLQLGLRKVVQPVQDNLFVVSCNVLIKALLQPKTKGVENSADQQHPKTKHRGQRGEKKEKKVRKKQRKRKEGLEPEMNWRDNLLLEIEVLLRGKVGVGKVEPVKKGAHKLPRRHEPGVSHEKGGGEIRVGVHKGQPLNESLLRGSFHHWRIWGLLVLKHNICRVLEQLRHNFLDAFVNSDKLWLLCRRLGFL